MSRTAQAPTLLKDLQAQVKALTNDLRARSEQGDDAWAQQLRAEYEQARTRNRTGLTWSEWRDGEVDLAAVAWVLATVFVRFCEDNGLIDGPWITGEGARHAQALDNETEFYRQDPIRNARDWLRAGFASLADLKAGRDLIDPDHHLVWRAPISADAASSLLAFWRAQQADGTLVHDLRDEQLDTRFLGDLYQDLSDHAKKKYALLQTPVFVEEFILDRTLTPAIAEFGIEGLRMIDPTCGSGHFLLGAFDRILRTWQAHAPAMDERTRVQNALNAIHGVDINPTAVAIARFRLTVAAMEASGVTRLKDAPHYDYHIAVGDSLIKHGVQADLLAEAEEFEYANEDLSQHPGILDRGRYHVVVGNPPYITVKDKALNERYRQDYQTCHRQYALSVPFMELFFQLAIKGDTQPAGYVGQITSNSFMKREFGSKVIEDLLSGTGSLMYENPVDLQYVIDTSGAYIPGHGTPTVILIGRRRRPVGDTLRAVLGIRGEPGQPDVAATGLVWSEIVEHVDAGAHDGTYVTVTNLNRNTLATHPWSLGGGGSGTLMAVLSRMQGRAVSDLVSEIGRTTVVGEDDAWVVPDHQSARRYRFSHACVAFVEGEVVRDFSIGAVSWVVDPYVDVQIPSWISPGDSVVRERLWPNRKRLADRTVFGKSLSDRGRPWYDHLETYSSKLRTPLSLVFAFVATHNHFVLDRGGKVFKQSAPVIKLPAQATEADYLELLGVLNSSVACFWLKQVSHSKGNATASSGMPDQPWSWNWEFTGTKLQEFPLPASLPGERAMVIDRLAIKSSAVHPAHVLASEVSASAIDDARSTWWALRERLVFEQEELDWEVYRSYGLTDADLTYEGSEELTIAPGERAFEIALARKMASGIESASKWFTHHRHVPRTDLPENWPADYRALVERRLALISSDPFIGLLERPEYKRRWNSSTFDDLLPDALRSFILDRLEASALWSDGSGPAVLSVAQLADRVRGDADLVEAVRLLRGAVEVDLTGELGRLLADEAVPHLAALRYKESGLRIRSEWESVWALQRREDAGEQVSIPVPPKYGSADFRRPSYWKHRGKLDVPKERFISYPGAERPGDASAVIGWAGWDHLDQARALARLAVERSTGEGLSADAHLSLVAGLVELEPWLHQWHGQPDAAFGGQSPAVFMTGFIDAQLASLGKTRADAAAWRPA
ncbi:MAG: BREX-2 system adenine-specific DNA-methyltransferase PglX [Actinomycetales bacterium]|nr:BREX-2 system adenine-specific DNA-methyltransferase PglX [Actinomycetales bacterium]